MVWTYGIRRGGSWIMVSLCDDSRVDGPVTSIFTRQGESKMGNRFAEQ